MSHVMSKTDLDSLLQDVLPIARSVCTIEEQDPIGILIYEQDLCEHYIISGLKNEWADVVLMVWDCAEFRRVDVFRPDMAKQFSHMSATREKEW